jgi:AcrR family transcriptional regulator
MCATRKSNVQQYEETRVKLLAIARQEFATRGYADAATNDIVAKAGVTRGALYYHFKDKQDLFRVVVEAMAREIQQTIDECADQTASPWDALIQGCRAFVDSCAHPEVRQILLLDAPAVLGWGAWRQIDARYSMGSLQEGLMACKEAGVLRDAPIAALTHLVSGALNEAVLAIAEAENPQQVRQDMLQGMDALLMGLRSP